MAHLSYWWKGSDPTNPVLNWGDRLNYTLLSALGAQPAWRTPDEARLVVIGSILEHLPQGWTGTVCGAGQLFEHSRIDLTQANVAALRGKLSAERVTGLSEPPVLGDPALLMPRFIRQPPAKYDVGILPHWTDTTLRSRFPHGHFIDPTRRPEMVIGEIIKCKSLISSGLHGLIIADAYGIPRQAELFPDAGKEGGDFKYRDYASVYDTDPHFGRMWLAPHYIVERIQDELLRALEVVLGLGHVLPDPVFDPFTKWGSRRRRPQISLLVPFRDDGENRKRIWGWLRRYWRSQLPLAELIEGHDNSYPFNKAKAINNAAKHARGRIFVVVDADAYLDANRIQHAANSIDVALASGQKSWLIPYNKLYRIDQRATKSILRTDPGQPYAIPSPPPSDWLEPDNRAGVDYGHRYGAMVQIMPREAFFWVGGWDPRFSGWGSEDSAMMRALDTLYHQHEILVGDIAHLWHVRPGTDWSTRRWVGQTGPLNSRLAQRYFHATGEPSFMRGLVDEHQQPVPFPLDH